MTDDCKSHAQGSQADARPGTIGCREVVDYSLEFAEGTLAAEERARFEAHLGDCPECVRFFETYARTPEISRECFMVQMPVAVKEAVRQFLRGRCGR